MERKQWLDGTCAKYFGESTSNGPPSTTTSSTTPTTRRHSAGDSDRVSQSLAKTGLDMTLNKIEAEMFAFLNPLQQGGVLADEVGLGKTIEAALVQCQYWTERSRRRSSRSTPWSGWLMFATNYDLTFE